MKKQKKKKSLLIKKSSEKPVTLDIVPEREFLPELKKYFFMSINEDIGEIQKIVNDKNNQEYSKTIQESTRFLIGIATISKKK